MEFSVGDEQGYRFIEGVPGQQLIGGVDDIGTILEACFEHGSYRLLLYPENLPAHFFDLSSGEAGAILQKLRTYHVRLAVGHSPTLPLSRRFAELLTDEQRGQDFHLFDDRSAAKAWLCRD